MILQTYKILRRKWGFWGAVVFVEGGFWSVEQAAKSAEEHHKLRVYEIWTESKYCSHRCK